MNTNIQTLALVASSIIGGGGVATIISALLSRKKGNADANRTQVDTILAIDSRLSEKISELNNRIDILEEENRKLHIENINLKKAMHELEITYKQTST